MKNDSSCRLSLKKRLICDGSLHCTYPDFPREACSWMLNDLDSLTRHGVSRDFMSPISNFAAHLCKSTIRSVHLLRHSAIAYPMDDISFTTFLKVSLLSSTVAKAGIVQRLHTGTGGYDFYKRLKLAAQGVAKGEIDPETVLAELETIKNPAERQHNLHVAKEFCKWWTNLAEVEAVLDRPSGIFKRPEMAFGIRLRPELRHVQQGQDTVTYLWATALPKINPQVAGLGLAVLRECFSGKGLGNCHFQIRDLRGKRTFSEELINNSSYTLLNADIALLNALWVQFQPKAA